MEKAEANADGQGVVIKRSVALFFYNTNASAPSTHLRCTPSREGFVLVYNYCELTGMSHIFVGQFFIWGDILERNDLKLDNRLSLCGEFVRDGVRLADIGTDHAYLPVSLALKGKISCAIAADINEKPLKSGIDTINAYGVADRVTARLSNGLEKISADECDDIVIAGMGGELICSIIDKAPWVKNPDKHLILQPMTRSETLRSYLYSRGFEILSEQAVKSDGRVYTVMLAVYCGDCKTLDEFSSRVGKLKPRERELDREYLCRVITSLEKKKNGLSAGGDSDAAAEVGKITDMIHNLLENDA